MTQCTGRFNPTEAYARVTLSPHTYLYYVARFYQDYANITS